MEQSKYKQKQELEKRKIKARVFFFSKHYGYDTHDENGNVVSDISVEEWKENIINKCKEYSCKELFLIFHDKDKQDDGQAKGVHCHVVITFGNTKTLGGLCNDFELQTRNVDKVTKDSGAYRYLLHMTDAAMRSKKYIYSIDELMVWKSGVLLQNEEKREFYGDRIRGKEKDITKMNNQEFVESLIRRVYDGEVRYTEVNDILNLEYGEYGTNIFLKHIREFKDAKKEGEDSRVRDKISEGRNLITFKLSGAPAEGKTSFATGFGKYLAEINRYDSKDFVYDAPTEGRGANFQFMSKYDNQAVTLIDDLSSEAMSYNDFLNIFDNRKVALVSNRYNDKYWLSDVCVITKVEDAMKWAKGIISTQLSYTTTSEEQLKIEQQVYRRIKYDVFLDESVVVIKEYDLEKNNYKVIKQFAITRDERFSEGNERLLELYKYLSDLTALRVEDDK